MKHNQHWRGLMAALAALIMAGLAACRADGGAAPGGSGLLARTNLVAWCIVPFDGARRGPEARAAMLERLGFTMFAYDYRAEHISTFDAEMEALSRHHVNLFAWWFPTTMNDEARLILQVIRRHNLHPQLWVMGGGWPGRGQGEDEKWLGSEVERIQSIAKEAGKAGCVVGLYNHGGWFGEPENQIAIIEKLRGWGVTNTGIIYNQHHGHGHIDRFPELMAKMKPYLLAVNLNGTVRDGDKKGLEILPLGQGELDAQLIRVIRDSGWRGPVGLLNHTDEDAEARLRDNLDGLAWVEAQLDGGAAGARPALRTRREAQPGQGPGRK